MRFNPELYLTKANNVLKLTILEPKPKKAPISYICSMKSNLIYTNALDTVAQTIEQKPISPLKLSNTHNLDYYQVNKVMQALKGKYLGIGFAEFIEIASAIDLMLDPGSTNLSKPVLKQYDLKAKFLEIDQDTSTPTVKGFLMLKAFKAYLHEYVRFHYPFKNPKQGNGNFSQFCKEHGLSGKYVTQLLNVSQMREFTKLRVKTFYKLAVATGLQPTIVPNKRKRT